MSERVYTLAELDQPRWKQIASRLLDGSNERFVAGALALVGGLLAFSTINGKIHEARLRDRVLTMQAQAVAQVPEADRKLIDRIDQSILDLAGSPWQGDWVAPAFQASSGRWLEGTGAYFRAIQTEIPTHEALRIAARLSVKDSLAMCALRGESTEPASDCEPGTACMGETNSRLINLRQLHHGLSVLAPSWADEARGAGGMQLGVMHGELADRLVKDTPEMARVASQTRYAMVIIDEVPSGLPDVMWGSRRDLIQSTPHAARMALYDAKTGEPLLKIRRELDASIPIATGTSPEVRRQVIGCSLGLELRQAMGS